MSKAECCEYMKVNRMDINIFRAKHREHWFAAAAVRILALDAVARANSGHSGMPMGMADVATVLFQKHLKFDASHPDWHDRDRFILSAGHGSMLLYALLYLMGYPGMGIDEIKAFRQWGAKTAGHPEFGDALGVETTTGPLGQGLANAVGFAIAEAHLRAVYGSEIINHHTYVFAGDGCLMEGISQEAIALAGRQKLDKLIVFWDNNKITIDGAVSLSDKTDQHARFKASGWAVFSCDGHDPVSIDDAIKQAKSSDLPSMIDCETHIAFGSSAQDTSKGHGALCDADLIAQTRKNYGWSHDAFDIPKDIKRFWENIGRQGAHERCAWEKRLDMLSEAKRKNFDRLMKREMPKHLSTVLTKVKHEALETKPKMATRKASELVLNALNPIVTETIGGSADLTGSNNTLTHDLKIFSPENRKGRYIYYGIREHAMAAAMNGMALHGGVRPYGGTFLCFADYARPAMRLSALMKQPVIYVMTHDSIGLGEDGPTHQPVEHLAMLRATPNIQIFRPADIIETAEAWEIALHTVETPSVLALSRQALTCVRTKAHKNLSTRGAYILEEAIAKRQAILLATGSEISVALDARDILEKEGIGVRVVSMPCWEIFRAQDELYRRKILPNEHSVRIGVEAAIRLGWDEWLVGECGKAHKADFVGMDGFGASAPAKQLFEKFGITAENVATRVKALL